MSDHQPKLVEAYISRLSKHKDEEKLVAKLRQEIKTLKGGDWIACSERIPEDIGVYLCHFSDGAIETFPFDSDDINHQSITTYSWGVEDASVTHWMDLPEAPTKV